MRHLIKPTRRLLRRVIIVLLAVIALVNVAAFLLTPLLDRYRNQLAALASEQFGVPVSVARVDARWRGFGPELVLHDLRIGDPGTEQEIQLADAAVDFGIWDMVRHLDLSPLRIILRDLTVHLVRHPDGRVELVGFGGGSLSGSHSGGLPLSGRLRLENATILWDDRRLGVPVQRFEHTRLRLHLWPDRVSLTAKTRMPGTTPRVIRIGADLQLAPTSWSGEIYLASDAVELNPLLSAYLPPPLSVQQGLAGFEIWTDWRDGQLTGSEGHAALRDLVISRSDGADLAVQSLGGDFRYRRDGAKRELELADLHLEQDGHQWPRSELYLYVDMGNPDRPVVRLSADYLRLDDLVALSRPLPLPAEWTATRDGLQPGGELYDLRLALNTESTDDGQRQWQLSARFAGLRSNAWGDYPGVTRINGHARGGYDDLRIRIRSEDSELNWPTLFRTPLAIDRLNGELIWQRLPDGSHRLSSQALIADTPDIRSVSRVRLDIPRDGPLDIDLHSELRDGDGRQVARYLPTRHMAPELVDWLGSAISSGRVPQGTLLLRGPLQDFPFDKTHNGRFEVRFDVRDLALDYQTGWPPLQVHDAEVVFQNNSLAIELREGHLFHTRLDGTTASIDSLDPISPLQLQGSTAGPLSDTLAFIAQSPLRQRFGDLASGVTAKGPAALNLAMTIGLDKPHKDKLRGTLTFQDNALTLPAHELTLDHAKGKLSFDLDKVRGEGLRADVLGQPARISVTPLENLHRVRVDTRLNTATLRKRLPALPDKLVSGATALVVTLDIPNRRDNGHTPVLTLASDLDGMAIDLPAPLGKSAAGARPLRVDVPLGSNAATIRLHYDDLLDAVFQADGDRIGIRFGGAPAQLPNERALYLSGRLPQLLLDPWLALTEQGGEGKSRWPPLSADLQLGELNIGRAALADVRVQLSRNGDGWQGTAESPRFAGRFDVPASGSAAPFTLDLARLDVDLDSPSGTPTDATPTDPGNPTDWPPLDLSVASLRINGHDFGRLEAKARHQAGQLRLEPLRLTGPLASFDGLAQWRGAGRQADTDLTGKLKTPALGKLLDALGYSKPFKGAPATADIALGWPGNPGSASLATLRGVVKLDIGAGQLLDLEPGVARAFGLLNFGAIQRRLRLDFSDLFGKGLAFDKITGSFRLIDGNAYTHDLTLLGPSSDIAITGRTGLLTRDFYQDVVVTPRFDATLPIAGALAGGPLAGVAVLVAQTVMKDKVDDFNRIKYHVTGSWDAPVVERTGGGGLSQLLSPVTDLFQGQGEQTQPFSDGE